MVRTAGNRTSVLISHLGGSSTYLLSLRAYNSAGFGPPSAVVNVTTKKPRESGGGPGAAGPCSSAAAGGPWPAGGGPWPAGGGSCKEPPWDLRRETVNSQ